VQIFRTMIHLLMLHYPFSRSSSSPLQFGPSFESSLTRWTGGKLDMSGQQLLCARFFIAFLTGLLIPYHLLLDLFITHSLFTSSYFPLLPFLILAVAILLLPFYKPMSGLPSKSPALGSPACGNSSTPWFRLYSTIPLFYITAFVCIVNIANSSYFDLEPPSMRPVQGQVPRGSTELLDPSSQKVASGQSSHPNPSNHTLRRCRLHTAFFPLTYSVFTPLSHSTPRGLH
jgi:hypothetical protein